MDAKAGFSYFFDIIDLPVNVCYSLDVAESCAVFIPNYNNCKRRVLELFNCKYVYGCTHMVYRCCNR